MYKITVADFKEKYDNTCLWSQGALNKIYEQMVLKRNQGNFYVYIGDNSEKNICGVVKSVSMYNWRIEVSFDISRDTPKGKMLDATLRANSKFELGISVRLKRRTGETTLLEKDVEFYFLELFNLAKEQYIDTTILNLDTCERVEIIYGYLESKTEIWTKIFKKRRAKWYHLTKSPDYLHRYEARLFKEPYGHYTQSMKDLEEYYREQLYCFPHSSVEYRNILGTDKVEAIISNRVPTKIKIWHNGDYETVLETHDCKYAKEVFEEISSKINKKYVYEVEDNANTKI